MALSVEAIVIRDDAEAGQVVIKFPSDHTPEIRKRIRSVGFCTKGPRRAFRLRKISGGGNTALDDARRLFSAGKPENILTLTAPVKRGTTGR